MRRIIERIVTVVTTTTWTISWRDDPPPSDEVVDPGVQADSTHGAAPGLPSMIDTKEVNPQKERKK